MLELMAFTPPSMCKEVRSTVQEKTVYELAEKRELNITIKTDAIFHH
jgi:hypothetical protein